MNILNDNTPSYAHYVSFILNRDYLENSNLGLRETQTNSDLPLLSHPGAGVTPEDTVHPGCRPGLCWGPLPASGWDPKMLRLPLQLYSHWEEG